MNKVEYHRQTAKEQRALPSQVASRFRVIEEALKTDDVRAPGLAHKREQGWGRRTMLVGHATHQGTTYRMAWEVRSPTEALIWAYGPHEGFYRKLARRARQ